MQIFLTKLLEMTLFASALILFLFILKLIFKKNIHRYIVSVVWAMILIRLLMPITISSPVNFREIIEVKPKEQVSTLENNIQAENEPVEFEFTGVADEKISDGNVNNAINQTLNNGEVKSNKAVLKNIIKDNMYLYLLLIYLAGEALVLVLSLFRYIQFAVKVKGYREADSLKPVLDKIKHSLNINQNIKIVSCPIIDTPVTFGFIRPKVLLPMGFEKKLSSNKIKLILLHELLHIKRKDILKSYIWLIAKAVHWFNPLVFMAFREYTFDIEENVDSIIMDIASEKQGYIYMQSIIDTLRLSNNKASIPMALSFIKDKTRLKKRVENMIKPNKSFKLTSVVSILLIMIMLVGCFTTACLKAEEPEEITKTNAKVTEAKAQVQEIKEEEPEEQEVFISEVVGTEERAIEIAMSYNISGAESITYSRSTMYNEYKIHQLMAEDDTGTGYNIYDFDGSIFYMATIKNDTTDKKVNISLQEAQAKAHEYISLYYSGCDDVDIDVTEDDNGDDIAAGFTAKGKIGSTSTGIIRELHMYLNANGEFRSISSEISPESFFDISDELIEKASQYALTENKEVEDNDSRKFYDDVMHFFILDNGKSSVRLLESDKSLISFSTKLHQVEIPNELSSGEIHKKNMEYIMEYFADADGFNLGKPEIAETIYSEGELILKDGTKLPLYIEINGKGELVCLGITPQKPNNIDSVITMEEAEKRAKESVISEHPKSADKMKVVKSYEGEINDKEAFIFDIEYRTETPTAFDYSFDVTIGVNKSDGKARGKMVTPILDGLDMMSEEEAIEKAREYLSPTPNEQDKYKFVEIEIIPFNPLEYYISFEYDNIIHTLGILVDTGELDSRQISEKQ